MVEVSPDYFHTLRLAIVAGRSFDNSIGPVSGVAIASVTLAERLWGGRGLPAGRVALTAGGRMHQLEIIGIAAEALAPNALVDVIGGGSIYLPRDSAASGPVSLLARSAGAASSVIQPLSQALARLAGRTRLRVRPLAEAVGHKPRDSLLVRGLLAMFSTLALTLAAGGVSR